ncbi:MAG: hypothetical protein ACYTE3_17250, partial [Planctomycetota bacterium]
MTRPAFPTHEGNSDVHGLAIEVLDDAIARCERAEWMISDTARTRKRCAAECISQRRKGRLSHLK